MKLPMDQHSNAVQALRPVAAVDRTDTTQNILRDGCVRLTAAADATYGINVAATVSLPAGAVEYIRVAKGDVLYIGGTINVAVCS